MDSGNKEFIASGVSPDGKLNIPTYFEYREGATPDSSIQAKVATYGKEAVTTEKMTMLAPLRGSNLLKALGVHYVDSLVNSIAVGSYAGTSCGWKDEVDAALSGLGSFSEITLSPKKLTSFIDISEQALIQESASMEEMILSDLRDSMEETFNKTVFGKEAGTDIKPAGIFSGATQETTAFGGYSAILDMIKTMKSKNISNNIVFVMGPNVEAKLKQTLKTSGVGGYIIEDGRIDGIPVVVSSVVVDNGLALICPKELVVSTWAGTSLKIDNYTQAVYGKTRIIATMYVDAKLRRSDAVVAKLIKTT